jgi:FkbM family methyltransferase
MKHSLPYLVNIPPFMFRGINVDDFGIIEKVVFIIKGKILSYAIKKTNGKLFCFLINLFYPKDNSIFFENEQYKKKLSKSQIVSFPNKRILRVVNKPEIHFDKLLKSYCLDFIEITDEDLVIDCGANVGEVKIALNIQGIFPEYIAFEPDKRTYDCLELNTKDERAQTFNLGLSDSESSKQFYLDNEGGNSSFVDFGSSNNISIQTIQLDSLKIEKQIKLFKVEAEGYEPEVILGAIRTLKFVKYISVDFGAERGVNEDNTVPEVNKILYDNNFELIKFSDYRQIGVYQRKEYSF